MNKKYLLTYIFSLLILASCEKSDNNTFQANAKSPIITDKQEIKLSDNTVENISDSKPIPSEEKVLNIYNWPDYIPEKMLEKFETETGIKVNYDTFENSETLNAKLVAGNTGYDIVVTGTSFSPAQTEAGFFRPLEKSKIKNFINLDSFITEGLSRADSGNAYLVPWAWGFTTVGINRTKVEKALGKLPIPDNSWDLVLNPEYTSKLKSCGIAYLDSPTEIMPVALHYIEKYPYSSDKNDIKSAGETLQKVRKDVRIFSSTMIDDIASGKACAVIGWSGDINLAAKRAKENGSKDRIESLLPSTGALMWFDTMAITSDSKHPNNAHLFIDYYLRAENAANVSNEMSYPTGNKAAIPFINAEIANNKTIFVDSDFSKKLVPPAKFTNEGRELMANEYNQFKKGKK